MNFFGNFLENWQLLSNFFKKMATFRQLFYKFGATFKEFSSNLCLSLVTSLAQNSPPILIYAKFFSNPWHLYNVSFTWVIFSTLLLWELGVGREGRGGGQIGQNFPLSWFPPIGAFPIAKYYVMLRFFSIQFHATWESRYSALS